MEILAHRGNLNGREPHLENATEFLLRAVNEGFGLEFDINHTIDWNRLVLSHDPSPFDEVFDVESFFSRVKGSAPVHALNIKSLFTIPSILSLLESNRSADKFFLFDFELLTDDIAGCRYLMRSLQEQGLRIAYRLSEREDYFASYLRDTSVSIIWLDEFEVAWATERHFGALCDAGKAVYYVSPDLHGRNQPDELLARWDQVCAWGVTGICTDYPLRLREALGETR